MSTQQTGKFAKWMRRGVVLVAAEWMTFGQMAVGANCALAPGIASARERAQTQREALYGVCRRAIDVHLPGMIPGDDALATALPGGEWEVLYEIRMQSRRGSPGLARCMITPGGVVPEVVTYPG